MSCALQDWVMNLTIMQQSVLIAAVRGPDTIRKDHVAKLLLRWYRRCILLSAFDKRVITDPYEKVGGSFTGPSIPEPPILKQGWTEAELKLHGIQHWTGYDARFGGSVPQFCG